MRKKAAVMMALRKGMGKEAGCEGKMGGGYGWGADGERMRMRYGGQLGRDIL